MAESPYASAYQNAFDNAMKQRALQEQMRSRRAQEILANLRFQQQTRHYQAQEQLGRDRYEAQVGRYAQQGRDRAAADTEANRIANTLNPPAAVAVTPPGAGQQGEDWTTRANAMRADFFRKNPTVQPGPMQPYTGGARMLPTIRPTLPKAPGTDLVAQHQAQSNENIEQRKLAGDADKLQALLSRYLPDVDKLRGIDADPKSGANKGGKITLGIGDGSDTRTIDPPKFDATGKDAIVNMDQLMERYRTYDAKRKQLRGAPAQGAPAAAPPAATEAKRYAPGVVYRDKSTGTRARYNADGSWTQL